MSTTHRSTFTDVSSLPKFPARPVPAQPVRPAWLIGLLTSLATTVGGALLGPVAFVAFFDLAPLHPMTWVLGLVVGTGYGLAVGIVLGPLVATVVAVSRASKRDGVVG